MDTIYKIIALLLISSAVSAQDFGVRYEKYLLTGASSDQGVIMSYQRPYWEGWLVEAEYRSIDWGNQIGLNPGYRKDFYSSGLWQASAQGTLHLGLALYQQGSKFSTGISGHLMLRWQSLSRFYTQLQLGGRYNLCPGYREYGPWQSFELPLGLAIGWKI